MTIGTLSTMPRPKKELPKNINQTTIKVATDLAEQIRQLAALRGMDQFTLVDTLLRSQVRRELKEAIKQKGQELAD